MLTSALRLLALAGLPMALGVATAAAAPPADCLRNPDGTSDCRVVADPPEHPGSTKPPRSGHAEKAKCEWQGKEIDCSTDAGTWNGDRHCYVSRDPDPPAKTDPVWAGHEDGAIYWCAPHTDMPADVPYRFWAPADLPLVDPGVLAQRAVDSMNLRPIDIGITPPPGGDSRTLVGIPTWMWVDEPSPQTWGDITRSASSGGVTVTATGQVVRVTWTMGDGTTVNCQQGTAYRAAFGSDPSPNCGHRYTAPGSYPVTATSDWEVQWFGGGTSGTIRFSLAQDTTVRVAEAFALTTEQG